MKKILILISLFVLAGCGPSAAEREAELLALEEAQITQIAELEAEVEDWKLNYEGVYEYNTDIMETVDELRADVEYWKGERDGWFQKADEYWLLVNEWRGIALRYVADYGAYGDEELLAEEQAEAVLVETRVREGCVDPKYFERLQVGFVSGDFGIGRKKSTVDVFWHGCVLLTITFEDGSYVTGQMTENGLSLIPESCEFNWAWNKKGYGCFLDLRGRFPADNPEAPGFGKIYKKSGGADGPICLAVSNKEYSIQCQDRFD